MRSPPRHHREGPAGGPIARAACRALVALVLVCPSLRSAAADSGSEAAPSSPSAAAVNPWATGGGPPSAPVPGALPPVSQAYALPTAVIHGGSIPPNWQPQPIPYAGTGADGKPVTMYVAPTYTFTFVAGPPVVAGVPAANRVNRIQANPAPVPMMVARAAPVPYQYPPGAPALAGQAIAPPALPAPPPQPVIAQSPVIAPPPAPVPQPMLAQPPTQWVSVPPGSMPVSGGNPDAMAQAFAGAAPVAMAATAGAVAANQQPPTASLAPAAASPPPDPAARRQDPPLAPIDQQAPASAPPPAPQTTAHVWRVVGVHDGDTVTCLDETNTQQKVRLAEIDAPELGQDYGKVARESLAELVFGKTVTVQEEGKDRYGRWIAHMQVDGVDVNRRMVAGGNAWHYADYSRDTALATLQDQARSQRLGLWAQPDPVPPWEFRQTVKKAVSG